MKIKILKHIWVTGALLLLLAACSEDFLDRPSQSYPASTKYFKTQAQFESVVNGIYGYLKTFYNNSSRTNTNSPWNILMGDMHSDNARYFYNPNYRAVGAHEQAADFIPDNQLFSGYWNNFYEIISRSNDVIARIDAATFDQGIKDNLKGQALFFRAFSYWWLAQIYGDAVIHLTPVTSLEDAYAPLSPRADIINLVVDDATNAMSLLKPKSTQEAGRVTSGTAKMLLAEVAIWEKDYETAETLLTQLDADYDLLTSYATIFNPTTGKNSAESIFEIQYTKSDANFSSNFAYGMMPYPMSAANVKTLTGTSNATALSEGEGYNIPSPELIAAYEPGDQRFAVTIGNVTNLNGTVVPMTIKYLHEHALFFQADENMPIYRYAEALLYLAEAINEQADGRQDIAMGYVNDIRGRAGLTDLPLGQTQEQVRAAILQERRIELAFEGKRFWDLVRFNMVESVISAYGAAVRANPAQHYVIAGNIVPSAFTDFRTKFNLPTNEVLYNPNF